MLDTNKLSRTPARRALAVWTLSLLMAACVRHLPVVGDEDPAPRGGGSAKGPIAGIGARRSAESAQRSAAAGSNQEPEQEDKPSESDTPAAGTAGSKAAAPSGSAPKSNADAPKAGSSATNASKAGSSAPASSAEATGGSAAPSTPSTPSTPSGSSSGNTWYCAQAANACSCAEAPAGAAALGDTCTNPHPTCCYEFTNSTTYRTCVCVPDGSPECMAYSMNAIQGIKKISSCPP